MDPTETLQAVVDAVRTPPKRKRRPDKTSFLRQAETAGVSELVVTYKPGRKPMAERVQIYCAADAAKLTRDLVNQPNEHFVALLLDAKTRVLTRATVATGTLVSCPVHPRDVFKLCILGNAVSVIFVHNHPSGDPTPSPEDRDVTDRLRQSGTILGIRVLDHVIVGEPGYYSLSDGNFQAWS